MSVACGIECVVVLGCMCWVWRRCTYIGANDNVTWTSATPDEFNPVPCVCRLVLTVYEPDLRNPHFIPTCGFHPNLDWVIKCVTYDVSMMSDGPSHGSVDFGLGANLNGWGGANFMDAGPFFGLGVGLRAMVELLLGFILGFDFARSLKHEDTSIGESLC